MNKKIEELGIHKTTVSILNRAGITTVGDLMNLTYAELVKIRGMSKKRLTQIIVALKEFKND